MPPPVDGPDPTVLAVDEPSGHGAFRDLARDVLGMLATRTGMRLWLVTRVLEDAQLVLVSSAPADGPYDVPAGAVLSWPQSLCLQMVDLAGPHVVPRVADVEPYARAAASLPAQVGAYVGVPLHRPDGALFGTLCGFDPDPQPAGLLAAEPLVLLQARLLAALLAGELDGQEQRRRAERAEADAAVDALTGLANRRAWDRVLAAEEERCRRYGHPACVLVVDLDGLKTVNDTLGHAAGDEVLQRAARALRRHARRSDLVARLGGDEFGVLSVDTGPGGCPTLSVRLTEALAEAGVEATVGAACRGPHETLADAWQQADEAMYRRKPRALPLPGTSGKGEPG